MKYVFSFWYDELMIHYNCFKSDTEIGYNYVYKFCVNCYILKGNCSYILNYVSPRRPINVEIWCSLFRS